MGRVVPHKPGLRALQLIRGGSYTVTLPKWWVDKYDVEKGARLFTLEDGYSLRLSFKDSPKIKKTVEISMDRFDDMRSVRYCLLTYYMQGAYTIVVKSSHPMSSDRKKKLREVRLEMPGMEIVHEDSNKVVYSMIADVVKEKIDDVVQTMHDIALYTHKDSIRALMENNLRLALEVTSREPDMLRIYRKLIRHLSLSSMNPEIAYQCGIRDSNELIMYVLLSRDLHRIFYHALYISRNLIRFGRRITVLDLVQQITSLSEMVQFMQQLAIEAFIDRDFHSVLRVSNLIQDVKSYEERLSLDIIHSVKDIEQAMTLLFILRDIRRIAGYSVAIADAAANRILNPLRAQPAATVLSLESI
ncbi:MAG: phosphate uptake regulator PhoU [Candidatus Caldarchaeum sp.]